MRAVTSFLVLMPLLLPGSAPASDFTNFESPQVRPVAYDAAARELYVVNTPDKRLAVFTVAPGGLPVLAYEVRVGLEPVSVRRRPDAGEVWVVNHLSDSVDVVDLAARAVTHVVAVGDEPTDVEFAGGRAFVSVSGPDDRVDVVDLATKAVTGRIDTGPAGIFSDDPFAFARSADGSELYLVSLLSGNRSTLLHGHVVHALGGPPALDPPLDPTLPPIWFRRDLIVQHDPALGIWTDDAGGDWSPYIGIELPDYDVVVIDTATRTVARNIAGAGTILLGIATHPVTGDLWVSNTAARNLVRFEPNLRGRFATTRISVTDPEGGGWTHLDLNSHVDYGTPAGSPAERALSLAQPGGGAFLADGSRFFVPALGSDKVGVLDGATGAVLDRYPVGRNPSGIALNEEDGVLYVVNHGDNTLGVLDLASGAALATTGIAGPPAFDPTPALVKEGRRFLYDAEGTSAHGDLSCATCHVFGDRDGLSWNLGNPQGAFVAYADAPWVVFGPSPSGAPGFHPLKGPKATQTLRGLDGTAPHHWTGDRASLEVFNGAFPGLLGRGAPLAPAEMAAFADFLRTIRLPPNPYRTLDDELSGGVPVLANDPSGATVLADPRVGEEIFFDFPEKPCDVCHTLPLGTNLTLNIDAFEPIDVKTPHLRNLYDRGAFRALRPDLMTQPLSEAHRPQRSGFGFGHAGAFGMVELLSFQTPPSEPEKGVNLAAFLTSFPTGTAPCVGHEVLVTAGNKKSAAVVSEIGTLAAQAALGKCDLVVYGSLAGADRGWVYDPSADVLVPDSLAWETVDERDLRSALVGGDALVYIGVPAGSGGRNVDRDRDGHLDADERRAGADPSDPGDVPAALLAPLGAVRLTVGRNHPPAGDERLKIRGRLLLRETVLDPTRHPVVITLEDAAGQPIAVRAIPTAPSAGGKEPGWTVKSSSAGVKWLFRDRRGETGAGGIRQVQLKRKGDRWDVKVSGKDADFQVGEGRTPVAVRISLAALPDDAWSARAVFTPAECAFAQSGNKLSCKS